MRWVMACGRSAFRARTFSDCCAGRLSSWRSRPRSPPRSPTASAAARCCWFPPSPRSPSAWRCPLSLGAARSASSPFSRWRLARWGSPSRRLGALLPELFPGPRPLHGRGERVQSRRHPRRLLRAVAGAGFRGARWRRLGRLLHRCRWCDQLSGGVQHAGDEGIAARCSTSSSANRPARKSRACC